MQRFKHASRQHAFDLSKAGMLKTAHGLLQVEQALASAKANMLLVAQRAGDSMADLYVPIVLNTIVAILVKLAVATVHAFPLPQTALVIKTIIGSKAKELPTTQQQPS